ncbi:MAG: hypothetical protein JNM94_02070 [Phycisphaerae bacterium]|nr:hypothetical protein [Phycisphaerae bacterium]
MKKLWSLVSVIAVVNLTVVVGLLAWLGATGRLSRDSIDRVREALRAPGADQPAEVPAPTEEETRDVTPTTARLTAADRVAQQHAILNRRLNDEREQIARDLAAQESDLKTREDAFASERSAWESATDGARAAATEEQFRKAVKLLESVPPKQGKEWILSLYREGKIDQAVTYLDAMSSFKRSNLLKVFKGEEENKVATDLLERLRMRTPMSGVANANSAGESSPNAAGPRSNSPSTAAPAAGAANGNAGASRPVANTGAALDGTKR